MSYTTAWQDEMQIPRVEEENAGHAVRSEKSDSQLVELTLSGDEIAFEQIFDRYKRLVASIAARYFRRPEQIEEIIQISFAKIFFELKNFRGQNEQSFASWLGKITTNACLDTLRNQKRKPENLVCELTDAENEALSAGVNNVHNYDEKFFVERDLAEKLLSRLTAEDRAVLQMLDVEEMSVSEVAKLTGWSKSKIKIRAFRARHALRKILKKYL